MYFDIEQEIYKAEEISERAHEMMYDINEKICDGLCEEFPAKNVDVLDSAILHIGALLGKLEELKKQLAYMRESELEFVQEINAEPSEMEIYKRGINA